MALAIKETSVYKPHVHVEKILDFEKKWIIMEREIPTCQQFAITRPSVILDGCKVALSR